MRQQTEAGGRCRGAVRAAISPRTSPRFAAGLSAQFCEHNQLVIRRSGRSRHTAVEECDARGYPARGVDRVGKPYGAAAQLVGVAKAEGAGEDQCGRFGSFS